MGVCNCSMFCCTLLYVRSSIAIILMGKRELVALLNLSSWCLVMVEQFFLGVIWGCLRFVIVVFPDHTYLLYFCRICKKLSLSLQSGTFVKIKYTKIFTPERSIYQSLHLKFCLISQSCHFVKKILFGTKLFHAYVQYVYIVKATYQIPNSFMHMFNMSSLYKHSI